MRMDFSKYTPLDSYDNVRTEHRGSFDVWVLSNGKNEPKGTRKISSKITRVLIESFLKRPSLKEIAFENLSVMANSAVIASQTPNFRVCCEYLFLALKGKKIRLARNGGMKLLHFADGQLVFQTDEEASASLGECLDVECEIYETEILDNRDHYFVAFTDDADGKMNLQSIERIVRSAENAQDVLNDFLQQYASDGGCENLSAFALHLPPRKRRLSLLILIPIIAAIIFFIIGALGKMRHGM